MNLEEKIDRFVIKYRYIWLGCTIGNFIYMAYKIITYFN